MPIVANSLLSSSVANDTFLDKTIADTKTGQLTLRKKSSDPDEISDVQATINTNTDNITTNTRTTYANQAISGSGTITKSDTVLNQVRRVSGSGGAVTVNATPFGNSASTTDGVMIVLRGTDATNTVTLQNSDTQYGAILNGDITLRVHEQIALMYDSTAERWIEQYRKDFEQ